MREEKRREEKRRGKVTDFLPLDQLRRIENFGDVTPMASSSRHAPLKKLFLADQIYAARSLSAVDSASIATLSAFFVSFFSEIRRYFLCAANFNGCPVPCRWQRASRDHKMAG